MPVFGRSFPIPRRYRRQVTAAGFVYEVVSRHYAEVAADAPVAWYRLGELTGTLANEIIAARNGAYSATGVTYNTAGLIRNSTDPAATFDGFTGEVQTSSNAALTPTGDFTAEIWFQVINGRPTIFRDNTSINGTIGAFNNGGLLAFRIAGTTINSATSFTSVVDGNKHFVALRRSGTTGTLWLDNAQIASGTVPTTAASGPWHIARNGSSTSTVTITNGDFETNTTGWAAVNGGSASGATLTRVNTWASVGSWSAQLTATIPSNSANYAHATTNTGTGGFAIAAGNPVALSADVNITSLPTNATFLALLVYYNASGGFIGQTLSSVFNTTGIKQISMIDVAPTSAAFVAVQFRAIGGTSSGTGTFMFDNVTFTTSPAFSNIIADEFAIYGTALSDTRLKAHYYTGLGDYGGAAMTGAGSLSAAGVRSRFGAAAFTGLGSMSVIGTRKILGAAALSGHGSMLIIGTRRIVGVVHMTGVGVLLVTIPLNVEDPTFVDLMPLTAIATLTPRDQDAVLEAITGLAVMADTGADVDVVMRSGSHHDPESVKVGGDISILASELADVLLAGGSVTASAPAMDGRLVMTWKDSSGTTIFTITLDAEDWRGLLDLLGL